MRNAGVWVGMVILILAGIVFWQSLSYDYYGDYGPGPGLFPLWLSGLLMLLSLLYIGESRKRVIQVKDVFPRAGALGDVLRIIAALVLFVVAAPFTGYTIAGIAMLFLLFCREYKWYWGLGISTLVTLLVFFVFLRFLQVPLPVNSFGF